MQIISYHPISEKEIHNWYYNMNFNLIADDVYYSIIKTARAENMDDEDLKKYIKTMKEASKTVSNAVFDNTHGFFIAKIQTYFRQSFSVNTSFSKLVQEKEYFKKYTKSWEEILENAGDFSFLNKLNDTPSSGIYIPTEKISELLKDYKDDLKVKKDLNSFFGNTIKAFIDSLNYANENNLGLLEANGILKLELQKEDNGKTEEKKTTQDVKKETNSDIESENEGKEKKSFFSRVFGTK